MIRKISFMVVILLCILCLHGDAGTDFTEAQYGIEMVFVEGGTFTMGCTPEQGGCRNDQKPAHEVVLSDFYIGKYEITQKQWFEIMGTDVHQQRDKCSKDLWTDSESKGDNHPMHCVSWDDTQEFIKKLNEKTGKHYRLPTEAEWEYAARGGNKSRGYMYSGSNDADEVAWHKGNSERELHPIGMKKANEIGIYDMSGNAWEWVEDWFARVYSNDSIVRDPQGPASGWQHIRRGGNWMLDAGFARVAYRFSIPEYSRTDVLMGFRLALSSK